jgi:predicted RNase H-like nuclease
VRVLGVDGCRGGWLAAGLNDADHVDWQWTADFAELLRQPADVVAVDIPIGLPDDGIRACDVQARRALGRRGVTVFPAPVRRVLGATTYTEARALLAAAGGRSMSAQAFGIVAAVRQVDAAVRPADEVRVVEAHPELAFVLMGNGVPLAGKRSAEGAAARVRLLATWLPDVASVIAQAPAHARPDDALDALACAWVARRWRTGTACVLGDGSRDARGLLMRIVG